MIDNNKVLQGALKYPLAESVLCELQVVPTWGESIVGQVPLFVAASSLHTSWVWFSAVMGFVPINHFRLVQTSLFKAVFVLSVGWLFPLSSQLERTWYPMKITCSMDCCRVWNLIWCLWRPSVKLHEMADLLEKKNSRRFLLPRQKIHLPHNNNSASNNSK